MNHPKSTKATEMAGSLDEETAKISAISDDKSIWDPDSPSFSSSCFHSFGRGGTGRFSLFGRDEEVSVLRDTFDRVCSNGNSEAVVVCGASGVGKTSLVDEALREYVSSKGGYYGFGKHEQAHDSSFLPFDALMTAISDVTDLVEQRSTETELERVRKALETSCLTTRQEAELLATLVSSLGRLVGYDIQAHLSHKSTDVHSREEFENLKSLLTSFLRVIACQESPVVIVIDDIQWADKPSLDIIRQILCDKRSKNLLFVATFREEEESGSLKDFEEDNFGNPYFPKLCISLDCFGVGTLNEWLSETLEMLEEETMPLSRLVWSKTNGNPLFVTKYLELLQSKELIEFQLETGWTWDTDRIISETDVTENVVDVLKAKLERLPPSVVEAVQLAAFLGGTFDLSLLQVVAITEYGHGNPKAEVSTGTIRKELLKALSFAQNQGFITRATRDQMKFTHDTIQQCFVERVTGIHEAKLRHLRIGRTLARHRLENEEMLGDDERLLFLIVDQLNRGASCLADEKERIEVVDLNIKVAEMASSKRAFSVASNLINKAIALLDPALSDAAWEANYDRALQCYTALAMYEWNDGKPDCAKLTVRKVVAHAVNFDDGLRVSTLSVMVEVAEGRLEESEQLAVRLLKPLGISIPRRVNKLVLTRQILLTKFALRGKTDSDFLNLAAMDGDKENMTMDLMATLAHIGTLRGASEMFFLVSLKMLDFSMRHGIHEKSILGFSIWSFLNIMMGKKKEALRFANLMNEISNKFEQEESGAAVYKYLLLNVCVNHWHRPMSESVEPLQFAYRHYLASRNRHHALLCGQTSAIVSFAIGKNLPDLEEQLQSLVSRAEENNDETVLGLVLPPLQAVQNLMGMCDDPLIFTGESMDEAEFKAKCDSEDLGTALNVLTRSKLCVACYMGDWKTGEALFKELKSMKGPVTTPFDFCIAESTFFGAMCNFVLASTASRKKERRKYLHRGGSLRKQIGTWLKEGKPDCKPYHQLLLAEENYANTGLVNEDLYESASKASAEAGWIHYQAMAIERLGLNLFSENKKNCRSAVGALIQAQNNYNTWGAAAKVHEMDETLSLVIGA